MVELEIKDLFGYLVAAFALGFMVGLFPYDDFKLAISRARARRRAKR